MVEGIKRAVQLYKVRGLDVNNIHADNEFECCRDEIRPIQLDIVGVGIHVGEVERSICTIKERVKCTTHHLPFKRYPKIMTTGCYNIKRLNNLPADNGVSDTMSPDTLVMGVNQVTIWRLRPGTPRKLHHQHQ